MTGYTVTTTAGLWEICIKNKWFTAGNNRQYEKMFYANEHGCQIEEIAAMIWLCSSDDWRWRDILAILREEQRKYKAALNLEERR